MPSSAIKRKLVSANNAWKGLTTLLRSKFFLLKRSKAFKRTATGLTAAISTVLGRRRRRRRFRLKKRSLPRLPSDPAGCNRTKIQRQLQRHGFAPVYVDDLFAKPATPVRIQVVQPAVFVGVEFTKLCFGVHLWRFGGPCSSAEGAVSVPSLEMGMCERLQLMEMTWPIKQQEVQYSGTR